MNGRRQYYIWDKTHPNHNGICLVIACDTETETGVAFTVSEEDSHQIDKHYLVEAELVEGAKRIGKNNFPMAKGLCLTGLASPDQARHYYDRASRYMIEMDWDKEDPDCDIAGEMERGALMFDGLHPN